MCVVKIEYRIKKQTDRARALKIWGGGKETESSSSEKGGVVAIRNKL